MAIRPRNPWKRPYSSFRLGQSPPGPADMDEQRITLYLPAQLLDWAEQHAGRVGEATVQAYCTRLLAGALEAERAREQASEAEAEARQDALEGFHAIAGDPAYLAEWSASATPHRPEIHFVGGEEDAMMAQEPSPAVRVVLRHAAGGSDDPTGFLATLRRGEAIGSDLSGELLGALNALEVEFRDARAIDRKVAYALHRLAFEGQVLHTDAYPGALDESTVDRLRVVQEAVDRVLSGEDIRYYAHGT